MRVSLIDIAISIAQKSVKLYWFKLREYVLLVPLYKRYIRM